MHPPFFIPLRPLPSAPPPRMTGRRGRVRGLLFPEWIIPGKVNKRAQFFK